MVSSRDEVFVCHFGRAGIGRMKFRHEQKYLINYSDYTVIKTRLDKLLEKDENTNEENFYHIRSLYFDDIFNKAYHEKYMGVMNRSKFRIRIYNGSDDVINLERKLKSDRYIYKQSAPLTKDQFYSILDNDYSFLFRSEKELHQVFYYECTTHLMRPRVIVDYEREPYPHHGGSPEDGRHQQDRKSVV